MDEARLFDHANVAWRDGELLMVRKDAVLPDRCLKCNAPAQGFQFKRSLTWASPWYALLILLSPILFIIVYVIVSRRGKVTVGVCPVHRNKRNRAILAGWLTALAGIASSFLAAAVPNDLFAVPIIVGLILVVAGVIGTARFTHCNPGPNRQAFHLAAQGLLRVPLDLS